MKKLLFTIPFFLVQISLVFGQAQKSAVPKSITISGSFADTSIKNLDIFFHDNFNAERWHEGKIIPVKIINGIFSVTIQPKDEISYVQFRKVEERGQIPLTTSLDLLDDFLVTAGDNIKIAVTGAKTISFTGKGCEKMNYQHFAGKVVKDWGDHFPNFADNDPKQIDYRKNLTSIHLNICLDSLVKIKNTMSRTAWEVLKLNTASAINYFHVGYLTGVMLVSQTNIDKTDSVFMNAIKAELMTIDINQRAFACTDSTILANAGPYINQLGAFQLQYNMVFSRSVIPPFKNSYNKILKDYSGMLRDKILAWSINRCFITYGSSNFVQIAKGLIKDSESKDLINKIYNKTPGMPAYNFSFEDVNGKLVKLIDLKGKVVVLEAWFNGCPGCIGLARRMHPIIEKYKENKNIVFISLNVDRSKNKFLDGVTSGIYGSKYSEYLYTNGKGWEHPMCLQYLWTTYPQMLIIDKSGKLISGKTIDPKNGKNKAELIELLDSAI